MSEMIDSPIYNFYDYVKSIYIYSHLKTNLIDKDRQSIEILTNYLLLIITFGFIIAFFFKIIVIIFYFIFAQAFSAFIKFIISIFRTKFQLNFCSSFLNAMYYLGKVLKRIYTFNFYLFHNITIGTTMIFSYLFFLISSSTFYFQNIFFIEEIEKPKLYMFSFYCHFESVILIQILFTSFYSCRDMVLSTIISIGLFLCINGILFLGFFITNVIENAEGSFEYAEPQCIMNVVFNTTFLLMNLNSLINIMVYKRNCKFIFYFLKITYLL